MYYKLETKNFINYINKEQYINNDILIEYIFHIYRNSCFSTFPYFIDNLNSRQALNEYGSGNCISLSLFLKKLLKDSNIDSFLIPATIPIMYNREGYLNISHVALVVPKNKNIFYIVDLAFYFIEPIKIDLTYTGKSTNSSINIWNDTITQMESNIIYLDKRKIYNQYQIIPKNTYICNCNYTNNKYDSWEYILREIINPDLAITNFFVATIKYPHITTTYIENDICKMYVYLKYIDKENIKISIKHNEIYNGLIKHISNDLKNYINNLVSPYFNKHIKYHLKKKIKDNYFFK